MEYLVARLPLAVLEAHVFPHLDIDTRLALGAPPRRIPVDDPRGTLLERWAAARESRTARLAGQVFCATYVGTVQKALYYRAAGSARQWIFADFDADEYVALLED